MCANVAALRGRLASVRPLAALCANEAQRQAGSVIGRSRNAAVMSGLGSARGGDGVARALLALAADAAAAATAGGDALPAGGTG